MLPLLTSLQKKEGIVTSKQKVSDKSWRRYATVLIDEMLTVFQDINISKTGHGGRE